jgi:hypothetical protein
MELWSRDGASPRVRRAGVTGWTVDEVDEVDGWTVTKWTSGRSERRSGPPPRVQGGWGEDLQRVDRPRCRESPR